MNLEEYLSDSFIFPENIRVPLKFRRKSLIDIPKAVFPYSEEYIEFALYEKLVESKLTVFLEPTLERVDGLPWGISGSKLEITRKGLFIREKERMKEKPDILVPPCILEVENFDKSLSKLTYHARKYEKETSLCAFAVTWKTESLARALKKALADGFHHKVIFINPYDGKIERSYELLEILKEQRKSNEKKNHGTKALVHYALPGSPDDHKRIQYELARWLWRNNELTAFEVPMSIRKNSSKIHAPDLIQLSKIYGFLDWTPPKWRPPYINQRVDVVSFKKGVLRGYEIKSVKDLLLMNRNPLAEKRALKQLISMQKSQIFNEIFLVLSYGIKDLSLLNTYKKELSEAFKDADIGIILQTGVEDFEIIKDATFNEKVECDNMTIELKN